MASRDPACTRCVIQETWETTVHGPNVAGGWMTISKIQALFAVAIGVGIGTLAAPAEAQRRAVEGRAMRVSTDALAGGVVFGPGGVEVWVRSDGARPRRAPRRVARGRYESHFERDVRRAYERYDRDVFKAREKYDRDIFKAEDRYYRRGDRRRYERDLFKAEEKYRRDIYKAERRLAERLDRADARYAH